MKRFVVATLAWLSVWAAAGAVAAQSTQPAHSGSASPIAPVPAVACRTTYNVQRFGAVGDDRTDNAHFIAAAVDAVQGGRFGCLYFPSGKYRTSGTATIEHVGSGITILGDGMASRILATNDADVILLRNGGAGFSVRDLYIGYVGGGTATRGAAVHTMNGAAHFCYDHLFTERTAYGLRIEQRADERGGGGENVVAESRIRGTQVGIYSNSSMTVTNSHINGGTYGYVADGEAGGTRMIGVPLFGALSLLLENTIGRTGGVDSFYGWDVEANYERPGPAPFPAEGVGSVLSLGDNSEFHCVDCWMQDGTVIGSAAAAPTHLTITGGNYFAYPLAHYAGATRQITPHALEIAYGTRATVMGGDFGSRFGDGIHLDPTSGANVLYANHIVGRPRNGIFVGPAGDQNVQYNTIEGWMDAAIATPERMAPTSTVANNVLARPGR
jgi:hypothetical protein